MRPRDIGTRAETALVKWLKANGFPDAERRALRGRYDAGDVTGIPGVAVQVKAGAMAQNPGDSQIVQWLTETKEQARNADAAIGFLVLRRAGHANPGEWWAWMHAVTLAPLLAETVIFPFGSYPVRLRVDHLAWTLRRDGYGNPLR